MDDVIITFVSQDLWINAKQDELRPRVYNWATLLSQLVWQDVFSGLNFIVVLVQYSFFFYVSYKLRKKTNYNKQQQQKKPPKNKKQKNKKKQRKNKTLRTCVNVVMNNVRVRSKYMSPTWSVGKCLPASHNSIGQPMNWANVLSLSLSSIDWRQVTIGQDN